MTTPIAALVGERPPWMDEGLCAQTDPEAFYPEKGVNPHAARGVCFRCPVREQCLEYALDTGERWGIWGGTTWNERKRMLKDRDAAAEPTAA